jgi:hypothetical protein
MAEMFGLFRWSQWVVVRHTKTRVLIVSNRGGSGKDNLSANPSPPKNNQVARSLDIYSAVNIDANPVVEAVIAAKPQAVQEKGTSGTILRVQFIKDFALVR